MKVKVELGAELDLLTQKELGDTLARSADQWQRSIASGVKHMDLPVLQGTIAGGAVQLGGRENPPGAAGGVVLCGPASGWYWRVERVSVAGILPADTGTLTLYKTSVRGGRFVTNISPVTGVYHPGGSALILRPDDTLILVGANLTTPAGTIVYLTGEADATPAEQIYKLII